MIVLGIDPGSKKLGWGLIDARGQAELYHLASGVLTATAAYDKHARYVQLWNGLQRVLERYRPDVAALEAGFVNGQLGALTSGAVRGISALACCLRGVPTREYANNTVKKGVTGNGRAEKEQVAAAVQQLLGLPRAPRPDEADALAVAITRARDIGGPR